MTKHDVAEKATFRTYHVLVHMADFEVTSLGDIGKDYSSEKPKYNN